MVCCVKAIDLLLRRAKKTYTYFDLLEAIKEERDAISDPLQVIQRCINLLKSSKVGMIRQEYRYLDDDGVIYNVDTEDLQAAYMDGKLHLEWRNYSDPEFESKVYVVFSADEDKL
ncbi:hypothetical protein D9M68_987120 [compost metagenome]